MFERTLYICSVITFIVSINIPVNAQTFTGTAKICGNTHIYRSPKQKKITQIISTPTRVWVTPKRSDNLLKIFHKNRPAWVLRSKVQILGSSC